ncbi:hypothetical protein DYB32_010128 [Aphanomyces invadans]|uniref:Uncharacterized protein n=1 Tax=Aphanomyces invadans TaxID=157072 RepID=A0A3R7A1Y5_9STRA|nr:hypothetical protein DYB32_010128 [Aphanomyces invadans]
MRNPANAIICKSHINRLRKKRQVKAKLSAPLEQVFVRVKPESKLDKVRQDLADAISRVKRINRHFDDVLIKEFASTDRRQISNTRSLLQTLNVHLHDCSNLVDKILLKDVKFYLEEKNLPLITSRGYNLLTYLKIKDVAEVVEGTMPPTHADYYAKNRLDRAIILSDLDDVHVRMVFKIRHAGAMLSRLRERYGNKSFMGKAHLFPALLNLRICQNESARKYCDRFKMHMTM